MNSLTLFIPGLLNPARDVAEEDLPNVPALSKLLACSAREALVPFGFSDALGMLFGLQRQAGRDFPIGPISRLVDDHHNTENIWMRSDPVHLAADHRGLILMDESTFTLDQHDALVLAASVKDVLAEHGMQLEVPVMNRWYVSLEKLPDVQTTPLHEAAGRDIHTCMPRGAGQLAWARLLNELQMALYASEINLAREQRREKPVNSVWLWGAGSLPELQECPWSRVFTDEVIARGFSLLAQTPCADLPDSVDEVLDASAADEDVLVVISFGLRHSQYHDLQGWLDFTAYLEQFWFADLPLYLREKEIAEVVVLTEHQQFTCRRRSLYKFWRRRHSLRSYLNH
ncbi:MAG: hypothetical protein ACRESK_01580 [Gammaproteobacteria bacterium]